MKIAILLYPNTLASGTALAIDMLTCASLMMRNKSHKKLSIDYLVFDTKFKFRFSSFSLDYKDVKKASNDYNLIILPPIFGLEFRFKDNAFKKFKDFIHKCRHLNIIATGTSVSFLARAGILNGKVATTHWHYFDEFKSLYPNVKLNTNALITKDANIFCARSINAQNEFILLFIKDNFSNDIADFIDKHFFHNLRFDEISIYQEGGTTVFNDNIARAISLMQNEPNISILKISQTLNLNMRTFLRQFKMQTGYTPLSYLNKIRLNLAKELLQDKGLTMHDIASLVGYSSSSYFKYKFKAYYNLSPCEYKKIIISKKFE